MNNLLSYPDAQNICSAILHNRQKGADGVIDDLYDDLYRKAARYANIRACWHTYTNKEKADDDSRRTSAHDAFIAALEIIARLQKDAGTAWREQLGDDRKQIGDFACYLALFAALEER